ncbi:MAG: CopG family transcriptional regulator [Leptospiraceae bacterium]|nr:CopG family transcriptional regulator [Leptospiraceae bacterium]
MKKKTIYKNAPDEIGDAIVSSKIIKDFLPDPEDLVFKEETVRVTINLSKQSIDFFKKESLRLGVPYQRMIKNLIDIYAQKHS